jgi:general secretion pathway protein L
MADTLLIHFKPDDIENVSWVFVDEHGKLTTKISHGPLSNISALARGRRATVLIDSSCLSLDSITMPSQNRQRQLQAVPFALEDNLAIDIEDMHFALGKKQADDLLPVISITKSLLDEAIEQFKQVEIFTTHMSADCLALPLEKNSWTILVTEDTALIKTENFNGQYCDREILPFIIPALLKNTESAPEKISFYHKDEDEHAADLLADVELSLNIKTYADHPLQVFSSNLQGTQELNILQGKYAAKREGSALLKPWKAVAAIASVLILLQLVYAGSEISQLDAKNLQLTMQIEKEFKRANPGARKFHNIKKRMERKLKELRGGGEKSDQVFLQILSEAAPVLSSNKNIDIQGIVYKSKRIDIDISADSLQALEAIKNKLAVKRKLKTILSTSVEKDKTRGKLRLEIQG